MTNHLKALVLAGFALCASAARAEDALTVKIENLQSAEGRVYVCLWSGPTGFPDCIANKPTVKTIVPAAKGSVEVSIKAEPGKTYAISAFHDVNGNAKMDTNFVGAPKEPVGFSNGIRPKLGPPSFAKTEFTWDGKEKLVIAVK